MSSVDETEGNNDPRLRFAVNPVIMHIISHIRPRQNASFASLVTFIRAAASRIQQELSNNSPTNIRARACWPPVCSPAPVSASDWELVLITALIRRIRAAPQLA